MQSSQYHYLPLPVPFFSILVGIVIFLVILLQLGILRYAYMRLGMGSSAALLMLVGSLIGSYFNLPIAQLPEEQVVSGRVVDFFGDQYVVPVVVDWPGTVIAINVGGCLIPTCASIYLWARNRLWLEGLLVVGIVTVICYALAQPVKGVGIAVPVFVPAIAAGVAALLLSRYHAAPLAYIGGSLGTLIGADLLNLDKLPGLGAPIASIGGAGTFDGIFLTGVIAVLIASIRGDPSPAAANR